MAFKKAVCCECGQTFVNTSNGARAMYYHYICEHGWSREDAYDQVHCDISVHCLEDSIFE